MRVGDCTCGHPKHHHVAAKSCMTQTVTGPPTPKQHRSAAPELHMGRTVRYCPCIAYEQPATGEQVDNQETNKEETQ